MLFFDGALGMFFVGLWIFSIIDVITTPEDQCRNLPKLIWLLIVVLLLDIGSITWLVAGRVWNSAARRPLAGTAARRAVATNPDDDEEFLDSLRSRAEEQRRRAREARGDDKPDSPAGES